jgi:hypothetical protein
MFDRDQHLGPADWRSRHSANCGYTPMQQTGWKSGTFELASLPAAVLRSKVAMSAAAPGLCANFGRAGVGVDRFRMHVWLLPVAHLFQTGQAVRAIERGEDC